MKGTDSRVTARKRHAAAPVSAGQSFGRPFPKYICAPKRSAITWYQRYLEIPPARRLLFFQDAQNLARIRKRLGELYDQKGERQKALEQYSAFVDQWKDADPELQPAVASVKKRMAELTRAEGH